jgi:Tir chaperone protein (CesT).
LERFSAVLKQFAAMAQLPDLSVDGEGNCHVAVDDMMITLRYDSETE